MARERLQITAPYTGMWQNHGLPSEMAATALSSATGPGLARGAPKNIGCSLAVNPWRPPQASAGPMLAQAVQGMWRSRGTTGALYEPLTMHTGPIHLR